MTYFYEYKVKNGCLVGGHNLEKISIKGDVIKLIGFDYDFQCDRIYWVILLDSNELQYLKISPMECEKNEW